LGAANTIPDLGARRVRTAASGVKDGTVLPERRCVKPTRRERPARISSAQRLEDGRHLGAQRHADDPSNGPPRHALAPQVG
jgi:hypothetical protein